MIDHVAFGVRTEHIRNLRVHHREIPASFLIATGSWAAGWTRAASAAIARRGMYRAVLVTVVDS
jgi:hypothetical protein